MSGLTVTAAVLVLALRSAQAEPDDGPIGFIPVLVYGTVVLALPFAYAVYKTASHGRRPSVPVGLVTLGHAIFIATSAPGNLMLVGLAFGLAFAIGLLWLAGFAVRKIAKPHSA